MKNYLRTQITLYEEDKNYPIWRRQERRSKYAVQLASWQLRSNSPKTSVCLSVHHTFFTMFPSSYHHEIFRNHYHGQKWCPCKRSRSKVKVTEVNTQLSRFRTLTPVWFIYGNEIMHTAGSSIEEVPYCFSRSSVKFQGHTALKIVEFDPDWAFPDCNSSLNSPMATKCCTKVEVA